MPRPCHRRHPSVEHLPACKTCQKWEADPGFRAAWERYEFTRTEEGEDPVDAVPCKHRGENIPLPERYKYNLGTLKDWYTCGRGFGNNGFVCPCQGCNPLCVGYELPDAIPEE